jgi:hypothetical protein
MAKAKQSASKPDALAVLSEEHRRMVAYGIATMHRFVPEPSL